MQLTNPSSSTSNTPITNNAVSFTNIATKSSVGSIALAELVSNMISASSLASVWLVINQLQVYFLLLFTEVYIPNDIFEVIIGSKIFLFPFKPNMLENTKFEPSFIQYFNIRQGDLTLDKIGVESTSTLFNIHTLVCSLLAVVILHVLVALVYRMTR